MTRRPLNYWREIGVPANKIVRCDEKDNFWGPPGSSGPCGPCSEIHYDFGKEKGCGKPDCKPNCECGRFMEIWNLVFTQYFQDEAGKRTPLPQPEYRYRHGTGANRHGHQRQDNRL